MRHAYLELYTIYVIQQQRWLENRTYSVTSSCVSQCSIFLEELTSEQQVARSVGLHCAGVLPV